MKDTIVQIGLAVLGVLILIAIPLGLFQGEAKTHGDEARTHLNKSTEHVKTSTFTIAE